MLISLKKFRKFLGFPPTDQFFLIKTFVIISLIRISLRAFSFQIFRRLYAKIIRTNKNIQVSAEITERQIWAINTISPDISVDCLPRALTLKYFLRNDKSAKITIGVNQINGFTSHAWVKKENRILIGNFPDDHFQPLWNWE